MVVESDSIEDIEKMPEGTRFYIVNFTDGETGAEAMVATTLEPDDVARVDQICAETNTPFHAGVKRAALKHLASRLWEDGLAPDGTEVHMVEEVSRRELLGFMQRSMENIQETVKS